MVSSHWVALKDVSQTLVVLLNLVYFSTCVVSLVHTLCMSVSKWVSSAFTKELYIYPFVTEISPSYPLKGLQLLCCNPFPYVWDVMQVFVILATKVCHRTAASICMVVSICRWHCACSFKYAASTYYIHTQLLNTQCVATAYVEGHRGSYCFCWDLGGDRQQRGKQTNRPKLHDNMIIIFSQNA